MGIFNGRIANTMTKMKAAAVHLVTSAGGGPFIPHLHIYTILTNQGTMILLKKSVG